LHTFSHFKTTVYAAQEPASHDRFPETNNASTPNFGKQLIASVSVQNFFVLLFQQLINRVHG